MNTGVEKFLTLLDKNKGYVEGSLFTALGIYAQQNGEAVPAREFMGSIDIPPQDIDVLFTCEGKWNYILPNIDPFSVISAREREAMINFLLNTGQEIHQHVNTALSTTEQGFHTDHSTNHVGNVLDGVERIPQNLGLNIDYDTQYIAQLAATTHDIGNLLSRKYHPAMTVCMLEEMFPRLLDHPDEWDRLRQAILFHNGEQYRYMSTFSDVLGITNIIGQEAAMLLVADKCDIGRHRIIPEARSEEVLDTFVHSRSNLCWEFDMPFFDEHTGNIVCQFTFNPYINQGDIPDWKGLVHDSPGKRAQIYASPQLQRVAKKDTTQNIASFEPSLLEFLNLYVPSALYAITCGSLALQEKAQFVSLEWQDPSTGKLYIKTLPRQNFQEEYKNFLYLGVSSSSRTTDNVEF